VDWFANWCNAAVLINEQLTEGGHVGPKHVAIECDFNDVSN
jgi:hypothetical protein